MDNPNLILFFVLVISYITGSFPTSIIMGKLIKKIDIRDHGSGNAGATNVFRVLGMKPALIVITIDILKGWLPAYYFATIFLNLTNIPDL